MPNNIFEYIDSSALDWVFLVILAIVIIWEVTARAKERKKAQWAFIQWLESKNRATPLPDGFWEQEEEALRKMTKFESKLLIPLLPVLVALASVYFCRWWMEWSIAITTGVSLCTFYVGIALAVFILRVLPCKKSNLA